MGEWQRGESAQQLLNTLVFSQIFVPLNSGGAPGDGQNACAALTNERHGNSILKNGQHLFTVFGVRKIAEKIAEKLWNEGEIVCFDTLKLRGYG
jgi:hypothetical protein